MRASGLRHPSTLAEPAVVARFLSELAVADGVSASTQNQAMSALLFLYREVLGAPLSMIDGVTRAKRPQRVPTVLTREEVRAALARLACDSGGERGAPWLVASLLYGSGLRLGEALALRAKDVDFGRWEVTVRGGKGGKDRVTMLPQSLEEVLRAHLDRVRRLHARDLAAGYDIRTVQELLGHRDVRTTMIYTHVTNAGGRGVRSPADVR